MNRSLRALVVLASVLLAPSLRAQTPPSPWMPMLGAGQVTWRAAVSDADDSFTFTMRSSRNLLTPLTGFEWGAAYGSFEEASRLDPTQTLALDSRATVQTPWSRVQPFVGAGPSLFWYMTNQSGRDSFVLGYNGGGGLRVRVRGGLHVIGDVRFRGWNFDQLTNTDAPLDREITLSVGFKR